MTSSQHLDGNIILLFDLPQLNLFSALVHLVISIDTHPRLSFIIIVVV
jgi:hypothetical protein